MPKKFLQIILSVPVVMMIYVPIILLCLEYGKLPSFPLSFEQNMLAFVLFWSGCGIWGWCFYLFRKEGRGSPLPNNPAKQLIKSGPFKFSRNPMIIALWAILLGETIAFESLYLFVWTALIVVASILYIIRIEEPQLLEKFGQRYMEYRADVRRFF